MSFYHKASQLNELLSNQIAKFFDNEYFCKGEISVLYFFHRDIYQRNIALKEY